MSMLAPYPENGVSPKKETLGYDMLQAAPYLPAEKRDALAFERLVDLSSDLMAPAGEIIARPFQDHYEILFGYDYLEAYQEAVPRGQVLVSLYHYSDSEAVRVAIDLNHIHFNLSLLDVADSYKCALSHFQWRNADLARALGLQPSTVCNRLKLTELDDEVKKLVIAGRLSLEQAKALSRLSLGEQTHFGKLAVQHGWTTRQLYKKIHPGWKPKTSVVHDEQPDIVKGDDLLRLEQQLGEFMACPIELAVDKRKQYRGKMKVPFFSIGELEGLVERIQSSSSEERRWKGEIQFSIDGLDHLNDILSDLYPKEELEC